MRKKVCFALLSLIAVLGLCTVMAISAFAEEAVPAGDNSGSQAGSVALGPNGIAAQEDFKIAEENIRIVDSIPQLVDELAACSQPASASTMMVYVPRGNYTVSSVYEPIVIPKNVILVSEDAVTYTHTGSRSYMFKLNGSIYGGTFKGNKANKTGRVLWFDQVTFSRPNGIIQNATVTNVRTSGIEARGKVKGCRVLDCRFSNSGDGVRSIGGATIAEISNCTFYNMGQSGIDLVHADINEITNNKIYHMTGHGISTDIETKITNKSDPGYGTNKLGCNMQEVSGNTIYDIGVNGIYLEENCYIRGKLDNNKIYNCGTKGKGCGILTHRKTKISSMSNNEIYKCKKSNIGINGIVIMRDGNLIEKGKAAGITVFKGAKLYIRGKNNKIRNNKNNGIQLCGPCLLKMTGKRNYIYRNRWGINMTKKCRAYLTYVKIYRNRKGAIYWLKTSKVKRRKCRISGQVFRKP